MYPAGSMMQVVPFTRCRNFECARCLPIDPAVASIECWSCGEQQTVSACNVPWPAARRCEGCRKTIPLGMDARLTCPWCSKSLPPSTGLASKDIAREEMSVLRPIAERLGATQLVSTRMLVRYGEHLAWTTAMCEGASNEPAFELRLECGPVPEVRFISEGASHKIGKSLRLMTEVQTGDAAFDRDVFIRTEAAAPLVKSFLSADYVRSTLRSILSSGFHVVFAERQRSSVKADRFGPFVLGTACHAVDATPEHWEWAIGALAGIARAMPVLEVPEAIKPAV